MAEEPNIIPPHEARALVKNAIITRYGDTWDSDGGWLVVHQSDYLIRINKGVLNVDFACDLIGNVTITESPISPLQASGRIVAWMVLGASMLIALAIAWATGIVQ